MFKCFYSTEDRITAAVVCMFPNNMVSESIRLVLVLITLTRWKYEVNIMLIFLMMLSKARLEGM